jgi:hypothetical protein
MRRRMRVSYEEEMHVSYEEEDAGIDRRASSSFVVVLILPNTH